MNITKRTNISETTHLELRAEFYNVFNHPQYGTPSVSPFSGGATGVGSILSSTPSKQFLDARFGDGGGRVIRYMIKFVF
jgi:hypothetical protein